jgi:glucuronokinase
VATARAALAGNPSDGYGGAVLALAFDDFVARATACPAAQLIIDPPSKLVDATVRRFARLRERAAISTAINWETSIPRGVGLGGSSALVIATLRTLCEIYRVSFEPAELAAFALAVEVEDLGIAGGLQDRVAQAYGGLTFMDFGSPGGGPLGIGERLGFASDRGHYEPLDPSLIPPLVIAWRADTAEESGPVHGSLRERFERDEPGVRSAMSELAELARTARTALIAGDRVQFARCLDGSFDARTRMMTLDPRHVSMIERARACGASANYTGSGGAIVAVCRDESHQDEVARSLGAAGCGTVSPSLG